MGKLTVSLTRFLLLCAVLLVFPAAVAAFPIAAPGTEGLEVVVSSTAPVIATYQGNEAAFSNDLYLMLTAAGKPGDDGNPANDKFLFNNHASTPGSTVNLGSFPVGTKLIFRLHVRDTGKDYFTGQASRNPDNKAHARAQANWKPNETLVSFEDFVDFYYNDLSFSFVPTRVQARGTINIDSTRGWQSTNLQLKKGQQFSINYVSGKWTVDYRYFPYVGMQGYPPNIDSQIYQGCKQNASWPYAVLLGVVGSGSGGRIFPIVNGRGYTAPRAGTLLVRIHDNCLLDNDGSLTIRVTLRKTVTTSNYAGYAAAGSQAHPIVYKNVIGNWKVPEVVSCANGENSQSAIFVGLTDSLEKDINDLDQNLVQAGTGSVCNPYTGQKTYYAVWQVYDAGTEGSGGPQRIWDLLIFQGNKVKVKVVSYGFGEFGIDIWNLTLGLHWQKVVSGSNDSTATAVAECIQEAPEGLPLTHFSRVTIACTANGYPIGSAGDIIQKFMTPKIKIGDLNASGYGGTFTVDWLRP